MIILFTLAVLASATLLFLVEPMFARMVLPLLGGSPAVWNTALVFYQSTLLAGYAYTHFATRRLGMRTQAVLHMAIVLAAMISLPIALPRGWEPPTSHSPVPWMLGLLCAGLGLPLFVVSTTGPLMQKWFAATGHRRASDPYFLYAASNFGSLLGLLSYPLLIEPRLRVVNQSRLWSAGYVALALLIGIGALVASRSRMRAGAVATIESDSEVRGSSADTRPPPWKKLGADVAAHLHVLSAGATLPASSARPLAARRRWRWVFLAFVPSSLMLGVTTHITTDIAAIPLLWVVPLAIYLSSFILAFAGRRFLPGTRTSRVLAVLLLALLVMMHSLLSRPLGLVIGLHLLVLFGVAWTAHGELARDRPATEHLTEFYLWLAVGGAMGGVFNALVAPVVFHSVAEYPIAIVLACMLLPPRSRSSAARDRVLDLVVPLGFGLFAAATFVTLERVHVPVGPLVTATLLAFLGLPLYALSERPLRFGLAVGAVLLADALLVGHARLLREERSFFGVNRVVTDPSGRFHELIHGTTLHGVERFTPRGSAEPLGYYHPGGPLGEVFGALPAAASRHVAVTGLGAGSMAAYARAGETWTFYEIDPVVERIASDPRAFTFLSACPARHRVVLGDARRSLAATRERFDVMLFDAYSSDAIPVHLLTREALALYLGRLSPHGVLVFHLSNRYFDLRPVLAALAADRRVVCRVRSYGDQLTERERTQEWKSPSTYAVVAIAPEDLGALGRDPRWTPPALRPSLAVWTDDFSSVLSVLK